MKLIKNILCVALAIAATCTVNLFSKSTQAKPVKVACVGNSITYGMKLSDRENTSYPSQLQSLLGEGYIVGNFGKNGATLLRKGYLPYTEQKEYTQAMEFAGDIVVIHLGINDTDPRDFPHYSDDFVNDYLSLIDSLRSVNPNARFILANLSPLHAKHYRYKSGTRAWRDSIRNLIPVIAKISGAELIDFGTVLQDRQNLIPDAIHPNEEGARILAETVFSAITGNYGGLSLPPIYGNGMVLQRNQPLNIKGKTNAGRNVTVKIGDIEASAIANNLGEWIVTLPPMIEAIDLTMLVSDGKDEISFTDVAVGEVWLASGQSNMEFQMQRAKTGKDDLPSSGDNLLRFYDMKPIVNTDNYAWDEETISLTNALKHYHPTHWSKSSPETTKDFSAVAYYYGKMLRDSLDVPVGIICNAIGGSPAESWIDISSLEHEIPEILIDWQTNDYLQPWVKQRINGNIGEKDGNKYNRHPYEPSYLFSSGIRPLNSYPIAGAIWYQGESNAHNIEVHEKLFPLLVESWRKEWQNPDMPFIFVQLSSMDRPSWPWFRDSQRRLANTIDRVYMTVSSDKGDSLDVHPTDKKPIGERLARQALHHVYGKEKIVPEGPKIKSATYKSPNSVVLSFDFCDMLQTSDGEKPKTFELAEYPGLYFPADNVEIIGNRIILQSDKVINPKFVRYGWQPYTRANLINGENLPASTFKIEILNSQQ